MNFQDEISLLSYFSEITDPRVDRTKKHNLIDILAIAICAVIADADGFEDMEDFGNQRLEWFKTFLDLPNGIPSHDTFARVFSRLDPKELQKAFTNWTSALQASFEGQVVAIDGKSLRRSFDSATGNAALHLVSAWVSDTNLVLSQMKVEDKSNEITAIPKLIELLHLKGAIVSIDAIGCQKTIAQNILDKKAHYLLAVKANQPTLFQDVEMAFNHAKSHPELIHSTCQTVDKGHGRIETRVYQTMTDLVWVPAALTWPGAKCVGQVISTREIGKKKSVEARYYISSLPGAAETFGHAVREHWGIENKAHWVLDVSFNEDASRIRKDNSAENMAVARRIALNLLKKATFSKRRSLKGKRKHAAWNNDFLIRVLLGI
jgi:predicted transposase YbfD/YdcC